MSTSNEHSFLSRIVERKRQEIADAKRRLPRRELEQLAHEQTAPHDFRRALKASDNLAVIAEMKKASPSAGVLREDFDPVKLAENYAANGAAALSILTDENFFHGHVEHLRQARTVCALPMLRKDFLIDPYQIWEARTNGADAVLLIVAILNRTELFELLSVVEESGMQALVETHNAAEIERALLAGAGMIGINNRDLQTFEVTLETTERLAKQLPRSCVRVAESGIKSREEVERLAACGMDAVLVGSHLMRQPDPGKALSKLVGVPRP